MCRTCKQMYYPMLPVFDYILVSTFNHRHTSLKKKHEPKHSVRPTSQKKLNSYIHRVVVNNLPPTVQVGGAVINGPRLPLPPIPLPYTAPPTITTSELCTTGTKKITMDEEIHVPQSIPSYTSVIWRTPSKMRQIMFL